MAGEKLELKEKLAAVDLGLRSLWDELDETQQKALKNDLFILNRFISSVRDNSREAQEHFIIAVNEYYNKHWATLQKEHPKLLWQLLCACSHESKKIYSHQYIKLDRSASGDSKKIKFLMEFYPNRKMDEIEMLAQLMSDDDIKQLAKDTGYSDKEIVKLL